MGAALLLCTLNLVGRSVAVAALTRQDCSFTGL
jgi:hypothetical protein